MSDPALQSIPQFDKFEIIKESIATVTTNGSTINWVTIPHNLGYRPMVIANLNDVDLGAIFSNGDIELPTWIGASISGGIVGFTTYLSSGVDNTNVYFIILDATATTASYDVHYYLIRRSSR